MNWNLWVLGAFLLICIGVIWAAIAYYFKMKELVRIATARHRAAAVTEKRAYAAEERARADKVQARKFLEDSWQARNDAQKALEDTIIQIRKLNERLTYR